MRLTIILTLMLTFLSAEPREALLIGNSNYQHITKLNNPKPNLKRLKSTLESLGFTVKIKTNLNSENLEEAIDLFANRLAKNRSTTGFLYYTGHGCQVDHQGYLLPINADSTNKIKIKHHSLKISEMIETLKASGNRVNMFFLDACRDIPVGTKGGSKGLGQIQNTPKGTLVVYATENGQTAEDNSDFINSIISSIKEPNQNIRNLPYSISDIFKQAKTSQTPIFSAVDVPKIVLNSRSGYIPPTRTPRVVKPQPVVITPPKPVVVKPQTHSSKDIVTIDGLMYQNQPFTKRYTWREAKEYCQGLTLGGYSDWRLAKRKELDSLKTTKGYKNLNGDVHYIREEFIKNLTSYYSKFWSSTSYNEDMASLIYKKDSSLFWSVNFKINPYIPEHKDFKNYALCVR